MFEAPLALLKVMRIVLMDVPQRALAFFASGCLALVVWLHRHHRAISEINGGQAAATILASHHIDTKVYRVKGWMVDCYYPKRNVILLSASNFEGTNVSALSIAAHEVGHVLQARRWYLPYWLSWLLARPAAIALAACFWLWLIGAAAEDQALVLTGLGCFALYLIYLTLQLLCEIDASSRGVRELLRHGFLQERESRIARRILRAALGTYLAAFGGTALTLAFFLPQIGWRDLLQSQLKSSGNSSASSANGRLRVDGGAKSPPWRHSKQTPRTNALRSNLSGAPRWQGQRSVVGYRLTCATVPYSPLSIRGRRGDGE